MSVIIERKCTDLDRSLPQSSRLNFAMPQFTSISLPLRLSLSTCNQSRNVLPTPLPKTSLAILFPSSTYRPLVSTLAKHPSDLTDPIPSPRSPSLVVPLSNDSNHRNTSLPFPSTARSTNTKSSDESINRYKLDYQVALERLENANLQSQMLSSFKRESLDSYRVVALRRICCGLAVLSPPSHLE